MLRGIKRFDQHDGGKRVVVWCVVCVSLCTMVEWELWVGGIFGSFLFFLVFFCVFGKSLWGW